MKEQLPRDDVFISNSVSEWISRSHDFLTKEIPRWKDGEVDGCMTLEDDDWHVMMLIDSKGFTVEICEGNLEGRATVANSGFGEAFCSAMERLHDELKLTCGSASKMGKKCSNLFEQFSHVENTLKEWKFIRDQE